MATLKERYRDEIASTLGERLGFSNVMMTPKVSKVVVNMGLGIADKDVVQLHVKELASITGQQPVLTKARKSISNFKLREGMVIGARVTLRGEKMYAFLGKLIDVALPGIRDFRGVNGKSYDGRGNYTIGIKDQTIFPELDPNNTKDGQGMDITIVTTAKTDAHAHELLAMLGVPFAKHEEEKTV